MMRNFPTFSVLLVTSVALLLAALVEPTNADIGDADCYYTILGITDANPEDTTERDIKSKWRKLSKQHHPDHGGDKELYQKIQRAYEVLGDRRKRKIYDIKGNEGVKQLEARAAQGNQQQHVDPIARMFGFGGDGGDNHKGANIDYTMLVTLEDIYSGAAHSVRLQKQKICKRCRGLGAASKDDFQVCSQCKGKGVVLQRIQLAPGFVQQLQNTCPHCNGQGKMIKKKCPVCHGSKVVRGEQTLGVDIEQGTPENFELVYDMEADQNPDQIPGDIVFLVQTVPHPRFTRKDNVHLEMDLKLTLLEALTGFTKTITHLDGHEVEISEEGVTQYNQKRVIEGEGMPKHHVPSERGDLIVTYKVELPSHLTEAQQAEIAKLFPK